MKRLTDEQIRTQRLAQRHKFFDKIAGVVTGRWHNSAAEVRQEQHLDPEVMQMADDGCPHAD